MFLNKSKSLALKLKPEVYPLVAILTFALSFGVYTMTTKTMQHLNSRHIHTVPFDWEGRTKSEDKDY
ncbi:hypothetical protein K502DRAFT_323545, partial [Neoconidiobolus thromboides FSU 785]